MPYQWPLDPRDLFTERYPQMVNTGLPAGDVDAVRAAIAEMWADAPGGWVHEWSELAARYAAGGRHDLAVLAYGWAKFPVLADDAKRRAFERQLEQYELASPGFPVTFERRVLELPYEGGTTPVPVNKNAPLGKLFSRASQPMRSSNERTIWPRSVAPSNTVLPLRTIVTPILVFSRSSGVSGRKTHGPRAHDCR